MSDPGDIAAAQARSAEARRRLFDTVATLQQRLDPRTVARESVDGMAAAGRKAVADGIETAKQNPGKTAGALALAIAFLARGRIAAAIRGEPDRSPQPARQTRVRSKNARPAPKRNDR